MLYRRNGSLTANPTSLGVSLRGVGTSGASRALVISDGIPLTDPFGGWVYWDRIPMTSVSAVEVVEGGVSDLYGGDALGGVINVIPRRLRDSSLSLETFYGNEQTPDASLTASLRQRPLAGHCFQRRVSHERLRFRIASSAGQRGYARGFGAL